MTEETLRKELKSNIIRKVYYLYGKEPYLVSLYAKMIFDKCGIDDALNVFKSSGAINISTLAEFAETVPFFAEKRVAMLNDLEVDKLDAASLESLLTVLPNLPDSTCVVIHFTGTQPDAKKANTKKLFACLEKMNGSAGVLSLEKMSEAKTCELITKRAGRMGCAISRDNAVLLSQLCLRNLTLIATELDKLCGYADYKGEITRKAIETLTARQLDSGVFALATEITSKRGANALKLLDDLVEQGNVPIVIMSALSMTFIDFYRAKVAAAAGKRPDQIIRDFGYPPNRTWVINKAVSAVSRLNASAVRECVNVLCDADYKLKSSPSTITNSDRIIMERAIAQLLTLC